jgi:hypothetical protein
VRFSYHDAPLSPAGRRAIEAFLAGRLPAGRLHEELVRAASGEAPAPVLMLPADTAAIPIPRAA